MRTHETHAGCYLLTTRFVRNVQSFPTIYASFYRGPRSEPFESLEGRIYARIIPHLRRSLEVRGRLSGSVIHGTDATAALNALAHSILLLDRTGRVLFINKSAERKSRDKDGIRVRDGRPILADHQDTKSLEEAIARVLKSRPAAVETIAIRRNQAADSKVILIAPLPRSSSLKAAAIIIVSDNGEKSISRSREFARIHGLTPTEIRLVESLSAGRSIQDIAMDRKVAFDTVNKQVKQTMAKIGRHRQVDIVRQFLCFPIIHDDGPSE